MTSIAKAIQGRFWPVFSNSRATTAEVDPEETLEFSLALRTAETNGRSRTLLVHSASYHTMTARTFVPFPAGEPLELVLELFGSRCRIAAVTKSCRPWSDGWLVRLELFCDPYAQMVLSQLFAHNR